MDRSLGFGSTPSDSCALFGLGFPALPLSVKLATESKSLTHYTKGTPSPHKEAPTACTHAVSGSISLPALGFFSPFPHGTGSLSVDHEYLALEDGPPVFRQGFTCPALLVPASVSPSRFRIRGYHPLWPTFPGRSPNTMASCWWLLRVRSPLLTESRLISVPPGTEMFQFPGFASQSYGFRLGYPHRVGFPIQRSPDQSFFASSPELFAGCHVFHRLWSPRHPPHALSRLTP